MKKPTILDLFCGAGGLSLGFEMAGFRTLLGIDFDKKCCSTFAHNFGNVSIKQATLNPKKSEIDKWLQEKSPRQTKVVCKDIRQVRTSEIADLVGKRIDVIVGGPPCQGFSMAGERDPRDPRNALFMEFIRFVNDFSPEWFVMENVTGLLVMRTAKGDRVSDVISTEFDKIGYRVKHEILNAADYGIPQKRRRVFFIGTRTQKNIDFPDTTHAKDPEKHSGNLPLKKWMGQADETCNIKKWISVADVLLDKNDVPRSYFHTAKMIEGFIARKRRNIENGKGFGWQILKPDEPSYTISARYWKDGADALVMYSPTEVRMLTELECARIQSFPDYFEFTGSKKEKYRQIGNAVPPLLAKAIAEKVKTLLALKKA